MCDFVHNSSILLHHIFHIEKTYTQKRRDNSVNLSLTYGPKKHVNLLLVIPRVIVLLFTRNFFPCGFFKSILINFSLSLIIYSKECYILTDGN